MMQETTCSRRTFLGGAAVLLAVASLPACASEEVVLGEWKVGKAEHGHTLFGFAQRMAGEAEVVFVRSKDEDEHSFAGPLIVSLPQLASDIYDPSANQALEFKVWNEETGEWQWLGVATLDRIVQAGERYRLLLVPDKIVSAHAASVPKSTKARMDDETAWALQSTA